VPQTLAPPPPSALDPPPLELSMSFNLFLFPSFAFLRKQQQIRGEELVFALSVTPAVILT
jgi:hypothetical protein